MEEDIELILETTKEAMQGAISHFKKSLLNIRAGKATPTMLANVKVEYYGAVTPLQQVGNVNTPDARTISVQPYEKSMISAIEKAIMIANLGFNPTNNGEHVIINIPPLTEERRKELVKQAKSEAEDAKIAVRNDRKQANTEIKKLEKEGLSEDLVKKHELDVQNLTNNFIKKIDEILSLKEKEIMTV